MNGIPAAVKAVVSVDKLMLVSCNSTYNHNSVRWRLKDGLRQTSKVVSSLVTGGQDTKPESN